jgi:amidase
MARTVDLVEAGMAILEPGFARALDTPQRIGRVRGLDTDPRIDRAVDAALAGTGLEVVDVDIPGWRAAHDAAIAVLFAEALVVNRELVANHLDELGPDLIERFHALSGMAPDALEAARAARPRWREELAEHLDRFDLLALPTLVQHPPRLEDEATMLPNVAATPVNLAGHPALSLPVPPPDGEGLPASLQLVGPDGSEDRLLAAGAEVEAFTGPYWNTF